MNPARAIQEACEAQRDRDILRISADPALTFDQQMAIVSLRLFGWPILPNGCNS